MSTAQDTNAQLRETISEGRALLKDFRQAIREADELTRKLAQEQVDTAVQEAVRVGLEHYTTELKQAMDAGVEHVGRQFDKLAKLFLEGPNKGDPTLAELIEKRRGA